jgi:hypothetical protein
MNVRNFVVLLLLALLLSACAKPVPPDKAEYVGEWRDKSMVLLITQDGSVRYKRVKDGVSTSIEAPLKRFDGDNFVVGVGPMSTVFTVSKPPYHDGRSWKMVVDGVELTRTSRKPGSSEA